MEAPKRSLLNSGNFKNLYFFSPRPLVSQQRVASPPCCQLPLAPLDLCNIQCPLDPRSSPGLSPSVVWGQNHLKSTTVPHPIRLLTGPHNASTQDQSPTWWTLTGPLSRCVIGALSACVTQARCIWYYGSIGLLLCTWPDMNI